MDAAFLADCALIEIGDALKDLHAAQQVVQRTFLEMLLVALERNLHEADHLSSMQQWLVWNTGCSSKTAAEWLRVASALAELPAIAAVAAEGRLSWDQLRQLTRFVGPDEDEAWAEEGPAQSADVLARIARLRSRLTKEEEADATRPGSLKLRWSRADNRLRGSFDLPADGGAAVAAALEREVTRMGKNPVTDEYDPIDQRRASALLELADQRLGADADPSRATVVVHTNLAAYERATFGMRPDEPWPSDGPAASCDGSPIDTVGDVDGERHADPGARSDVDAQAGAGAGAGAGADVDVDGERHTDPETGPDVDGDAGVGVGAGAGAEVDVGADADRPEPTTSRASASHDERLRVRRGPPLAPPRPEDAPRAGGADDVDHADEPSPVPRCRHGNLILPQDAPRAPLRVRVDRQGLAHFDNSMLEAAPIAVAPAILSRMLCDANVEIAFENDQGTAIGVGRAARTPPAWLARQVRARDAHCRFPGCTNPRVQLHHLSFWDRDKGPTDLINLLGFCGRDHPKFHGGGWSVVGDAEDHVFVDPTGHIITPGNQPLSAKTRALLDRHLPVLGTSRCNCGREHAEHLAKKVARHIVTRRPDAA